MNKIFKQKSFLALLLSLPALAYVNYRAYDLAFTYDECWTYLGYATQSVWSIVTNASPAANNHILHSLLMKLVTPFAGMNEYLLRLPVLAAMPVMLIYLFRISVVASPGVWWLPFISVLYQPYLLDYFSIARGYALAIAFMLAAIDKISSYSKTGKRRDFVFACAFSFLAAYSNFAYVLVALAVAGALFYASAMKDDLRWSVVVLAIFSGISTTAFYWPIHKLIEAKELYYGGNTGFYADTMVTLANRALYDLFDGEVLAPVFMALLILGALLFFYQVRYKQVELSGWVGFVSFAVALGSVAQHHLTGSPYLIDRTAMMLLPLIVLQLAFLIAKLDGFIKIKVLSLSFGLCVLILFAASFNFSYQLDFKRFADIERALLLVKERTMNDEPFHLGKSKYMNATIGFYKRKHSIDAVLPADLSFCDEAGPTPFYYLFAADKHCVDGKNVQLEEHFEVSDTYLYKFIK